MRAPKSCLGVVAWIVGGLFVIGLIQNYPWLLLFAVGAFAFKVWQSSQRSQQVAARLAQQQSYQRAEAAREVARQNQEREELAASVARRLNLVRVQAGPPRCANCGAPRAD